MTNEEKELLFKEICACLHYGVKIFDEGFNEYEYSNVIHIGNDYTILAETFDEDIQYFPKIDDIKIYLRPMSSMTEEEFQKLRSICPHSIINKTNVTGWFIGINGSDYGRISRIDEISKFIDWLNAHHFDYRGLIEKGLAIEAPKNMYKV